MYVVRHTKKWAIGKMPSGFYIGPLFVHFYGIIIVSGAILAAFLAEREARRRGYDTEIVWDALLWLMVAGIIGARIWHILTPPQSMVERDYTTQYYLTHPLEALNIRKGGLGIPGAVIGGAIALYVYTRRRKVAFADWADIAAPALALGQAVGRWGNFFNQEVYGAPTDLPWGIFIEEQYRLDGFKQFTHFHPLFLYESLWNLVNMVLLLWLGRRYAQRLKSGDIFLTYLLVYPVGRFLLEFLRLDPAQLGGVNANQTFMVVVAIIAGSLLLIRHKKRN
jgi:phosphatidylglycerol:prolipoprotein diacylglycerol transferase